MNEVLDGGEREERTRMQTCGTEQPLRRKSRTYVNRSAALLYSKRAVILNVIYCALYYECLFTYECCSIVRYYTRSFNGGVFFNNRELY